MSSYITTIPLNDATVEAWSCAFNVFINDVTVQLPGVTVNVVFVPVLSVKRSVLLFLFML